MIKNIDKTHIYKISLESAVKCNLNCKYCLIHQNAEASIIEEFANKTNEALINGEYLSNVKKSLQRLETPFADITALEIWGQEPTLMLQYFIPVMQDWFKTFYNINYVMFSTNCMLTTIDDLFYEFITILDGFLDHNVDVVIQVSYDGLAEESARGGKINIVKNNLTNIMKKLSNVRLEHIHLDFNLHLVMSNYLVNCFLENENNIKLFFDDIEDLYARIRPYDINKNIHLQPVTFQYMNGSYATTQDGVDLVNAMNKVDKFLMINRSKYIYFDEHPFPIDMSANIIGCYVHTLPDTLKRIGALDLNDYVNRFLEGDHNIQQTYHTDFCGTMLQDLKIMYDGTMVSCQNLMFDAYNKIYDKPTNYSNSISDLGRKQSLKNEIVNLITGTDEEIDQALGWAFQSAEQNNMRMMVNMICNMMFMLAQIGQIDGSYAKDLDKIKRHAFLIAASECCYYNLITTTGSILMHSVLQIRYFCNGLLDRAEQMINFELRAKGDRFDERRP